MKARARKSKSPIEDRLRAEATAAGTDSADIAINSSMKAELSRLGKRFELILNSAGEGIYGTDIDGKILFINERAAGMFGYETKEMLGKAATSSFITQGQTAVITLSRTVPCTILSKKDRSLAAAMKRSGPGMAAGSM